jgi:ATP-dependent Clp protease ATP-binding subunit ClpX
MPSGKDMMAGRRGGNGGAAKKNAFCSFCRKSYRDVGPLVEGPGDVYICGECIELCQSILDQEQRRRGPTKKLFNEIPSPREIVEHLDQYVIGQVQPLQATERRLGRIGHRNREIEYPSGRSHR